MSADEENFVIIDDGSENSHPKAFTEEENFELVQKYISNRGAFHRKFKTGSKNGPSEQDVLAKKWAVELSGISGVERTAAQVKQRITDIRKRVRTLISNERTSASKTGGGKGRPVKVEPYLLPLKELMQCDENTTGIDGGAESDLVCKIEKQQVKPEPEDGIDVDVTPSRPAFRHLLKASRRLPDAKHDLRELILKRELQIKDEELSNAKKKANLLDLKMEIAKQQYMNEQLQETLLTAQLHKMGIAVNVEEQPLQQNGER